MAGQNAARDENRVPGLLAVSSADGNSLVRVYADPDTHRLLVQTAPAAISGTGAPAATPAFLGQTYVDTEGPDVYYAAGLTSSDWVAIYTAP